MLNCTHIIVPKSIPEKGVEMLLVLNMMDEGAKGRPALILAKAAAEVNNAPRIQSKNGRMACYFTDHQVARYVDQIAAVANLEGFGGVDSTLKQLALKIGGSERLVIFQELNDLVLVNEKDEQKFSQYLAAYTELSRLDEKAEPWWKFIADDIKAQKRPTKPSPAS